MGCMPQKITVLCCERICAVADYWRKTLVEKKCKQRFSFLRYILRL